MTAEASAAPIQAVIRPAERGDVAGIQRVARLSWRKTYSPFVPAADLERVIDLLYSDERLTAQRPGLVRLVADVAGEVVGYAFAGRDPDRSVHLYAIYVLPPQQRQGVGRALLAEALRPFEEEGDKEAWIGVYPQNHSARRFYERQGAALVEGRKDVLEVAGVRMDEVTYRVPLPLA